MPAINKPLYIHEKETLDFYIGFVSYDRPPLGEVTRSVVRSDENPLYDPIPLDDLGVCLNTTSLPNTDLPIVNNNYRGWYSVNSSTMVTFFDCVSAHESVPSSSNIHELRRVFIVPDGYSVASADFYMFNQIGNKWFCPGYEINEVFPDNHGGMSGRFFEIVTTNDVDGYIAVKIVKD